MDHRPPGRRQRGDDRGDAARPAPRAGGQLLQGRRSRVRGVRRARGWVRDLRRLHHLPRLHDLRPVARGRGGRGDHRGPAARDGGAVPGHGPAAPGRRARLLRTLGHPPGVAGHGGGRAATASTLDDRAVPERAAREPADPGRAGRVREMARSDLGPRGGPARPDPRRGGRHPGLDLARPRADRGRRLRLHAVLRRQRGGRALAGDADGLGDHGDRADADWRSMRSTARTGTAWGKSNRWR